MTSNRDYGTRQDQIHPFFEKKREWSRVKDTIVSKYLTAYLRTVKQRGRPIIIVDAFCGPGMFGDGTKGSPLLICERIRDTPRAGVGIGYVCADTHPAHQEEILTNLRPYIAAGIATEPLHDFTEALGKALEIGRQSTIFFYLDPYGIKDLEFDTVRQIYERSPQQSTEVLINFNFRTFMRMSGNWSYSERPGDTSQKVKASKVETVSSVMGGDYWIDIVTDPSLRSVEREDAVVEAYVDRVRGFFDYTYSIPVKEVDPCAEQVPHDELAKYHLIFGTRHPRAVVYMNDVALSALQPYLNQFTAGLLFSVTPGRYQPAHEEAVKACMIKAVSSRPLRRPEIYEAVIPEFFLQRPKKVYRAMIDGLVFEEQRLFADPTTLKRKGQLNDLTLLATRPWG